MKTTIPTSTAFPFSRLLFWSLLSCNVIAAESEIGATSTTTSIYEQDSAPLDWSDSADFENAERGLIATPEDDAILAGNGQTVWVYKDYDELRNQAAPDTVHPVLWRQVQLNASTGLFRVTDNIYQIRGFDLANMTVIESDTGIIVIDPLTSVESARAAINFYYEHRGEKPVRAVIYTHNHLDHFGGVEGVVSKDQVASGDVRIFAPLNFPSEAMSENLLAGNAMLRRTIWYSGIPLPRSPYGTVDAGLGPGVANGIRSYIAPTDIVEEQIENHTIDGFEIEFYLANNTEAPSELVMYYPDERVLNVSEVAVHTVHNLLTPRGTKVRDTLEWVRLLDALLYEYAPRADIMIAQHHWPSWDRAALTAHLKNQRDFYKFTHDRALHLANQGYNKEEISEALELPPSLASQWTLQDYYGTLGSGGKAVYQFYLGWYDGNPVKLQQLSESKSAAMYVDYMGGSDSIIAKARADYEAGNYQWVVQVLQHIIFAEPDNQEAKNLSADAMVQLGYQQISATWRNLYLSAAHELRNGIMAIPISASGNVFTSELTPENVLDYASLSLDSMLIDGIKLKVNVTLADIGEKYQLSIDNGVLSYYNEEAVDPDLNLTTDKVTFAEVLSKQTSLSDAVAAGDVEIDSNHETLSQVLDAIVIFSPNFSLIGP